MPAERPGPARARHASAVALAAALVGARATTAPPAAARLTPGGAARIRSGRWAGALGVALVGVFSVAVTAAFSRGLAYLLGAYALVLLAALVVPWPLVRRRAVWWCGLTLPLAAFLQLALALPGFAVLSATLPRGRFAAVAAATAAAVLVAAVRYYRLYDAAWERRRRDHERLALDLERGTYDVQRGFAALTLPGRAASRWADRGALSIASGVAAAAAAAGPFAVAGVDYRAWILAVAGPVVAVLFVQAPVQAAVHLRRLLGYERRLGRPILNR